MRRRGGAQSDGQNLSDRLQGQLLSKLRLIDPAGGPELGNGNAAHPCRPGGVVRPCGIVECDLERPHGRGDAFRLIAMRLPEGIANRGFNAHLTGGGLAKAGAKAGIDYLQHAPGLFEGDVMGG